MHSRFHSASVVKSMLLVAYLRKLAAEHRGLDASSKGLMYPMIHSSDNDSASSILAIVGQRALDRVARDAHMVDYQPGGGTWGFTEVSAADLARFFYRQDPMIPPRFVAYARWLLSTIEAKRAGAYRRSRGRSSASTSRAAGCRNWKGWSTRRRAWSDGGSSFSLAVLSTHDPSMRYGERTIAGVTARLLGRAG